MSKDLVPAAQANESVMPVTLPSDHFATLSPADIDQLDKMEAMDIELMSDYWTPQATGEKKKLLFSHFGNSQAVDQQSNEVIDLFCAYFWESYNGSKRLIRNGSKRLVGTLQGYNPPRFWACEITYKGKKKNATNQFSSDEWSVKPLSPITV